MGTNCEWKVTPHHIRTMKSRLPNNSTFEILTAHIWRCVTKARDLPKDQRSTLQFSVSGRSRLCPPAPPGYFGNLVLHPTTTALCGELTSESLKHTVDRIRKAMKKVDNEYIRSAIDYLKQQEDKAKIAENLIKSGSPNFRMVSWVNTPFYDPDFGWGKPLYFLGLEIQWKAKQI